MKNDAPCITIVTEAGLPNGYAASNYVRLLATGLGKAGATVSVLIPWHTEHPDRPLNTSPDGELDGFRFEYTTDTPLRPTNRTARFMQTFRAQLRTMDRLTSLKKKGQLDSIIYYGNHLENHILYNLAAKILGVPFITFLVEWFPAIPRRRTLRKFYDRCFTMLSCKTPAGLVVISSYLQQRAHRHRPRLFRQPAIMKMPIMLNPVSINHSENFNYPSPYLFFCADLDGYSHDAIMLMKAFAILQRNDLHLILVGQASSEILAQLNNQVQQAGIASQVMIIADYMSETELHNMIGNATLLLAPLHDDIRSQARFPSKLADYLMSGRPVVTSAFGEITEYLADENNAFLCSADTTEAFAQTIDRALNYPDKNAIGLAGRRLALDQFDYRVHGKRLYKFIQQL